MISRGYVRWLGVACLITGCSEQLASTLECDTPGCPSAAGPEARNDTSVAGAAAANADPTLESTLVAASADALFRDGQPASRCDASLVGQLGYTPLRRLTQTQYQKTVEDLFAQYGIALDPALTKGVPGDGLAGAFPSNAAMDASEQHVRAYETSAQAVAAVVTADANLPLLAAGCTAEDAVCVRGFIEDFATRAFRSGLADDQRNALSAVYQAGASTGFRDGVALVVEAVLQSPEFLYHVESTLNATGGAPLDPSELAARMSYFLWNSLPDDELTRAAAAQELSDDVALRAQAERMLADPKGERSVRLFTHYWLSLGQAAVADVKPMDYPDYTGPSYNQAALAETHAFMQYMVRGAGGGTLQDLFTSTWGFPTPELAKVYGSQASDGVTPVALPAAQRAGLLTQAGFLLAHSDPNFKTSAIKRGSTVVNNFLCFQLQLPSNIDIDFNIPDGGPGQSARDRLEQHTASAACNACHGIFNPVGFTFDKYDAIGKVRDVDPYGNKLRDDAVLATGDPALDGETMGPVELGQKIASSDGGKACMVRQMYRHAFARMETRADTCTLVDIAQRFAASNFDVRELMLDIVTSEGFRRRSGG